MLKGLVVALAGALYLAAALPVSAQQINQPPGASSSSGQVELTSSQRSQIAETIIARWSGQVLRSTGADLKAWSSKLRKTLAAADAANAIRAGTMPSLDLVHAALVGAVIDNSTLAAAMTGGSPGAPMTLGSVLADTTYTPLPFGRCRVASSIAISNPLPAGVVRPIDTEDATSYTSQGGTGSANGDGATNCGIPNFVTALAVSVSSRNPVANGVLKVFANDQPNSAGNTILFSAAGAGGAADLIVRSCQTCGTELAIHSTAQTDYIIDVIGYFMPPQATALECTRPNSGSANVASGQELTVSGFSCSTGFTLVSTTCSSSSPRMPILAVNYGSCRARNDDSISATLTARSVCCRVPGR